MPNTRLVKTYPAQGDLPPYRIVAPALSTSVVLASDPLAPLLGTTDQLGKKPNGTADIYLSDLPEVELGGVVATGDPLTADDQGRAIKATISGQRIIGFAMGAGTEGVIITYQFAPGFYTSV